MDKVVASGIFDMNAFAIRRLWIGVAAFGAASAVAARSVEAEDEKLRVPN